ncbi:GDSL-type esterase/lipase family protein [Mucilaginibacter sp.]|uniref:GDSL-type esterase/lipase family protein n=1 Tax=Mucilaginibacter sp. TaxID=1882438 RepID=UPI00284B0CCF|nr:GDSL-type esterase/lipase family protein [Mucilaginibacter sp.]MDR3693425.1 GDSL-type esterase/lipase family protein [Mucilaginibacter sp.]
MYWYEDDVKQLEQKAQNLNFVPETLFYGSSSIRLWSSLNKDFPEYKPLNLGFGGSTLAACVWFFERVMKPYQPKRLVIYAGDNDLGDGRHPEEVFIFFQEMAVKINARFGNIPVYFISLKPSISRWHMANVFRFTNTLIEKEIKTYATNWHFVDVFNPMLDPAGKPRPELFAFDGLHLSAKGYALWRAIILNCILHMG